MMTLGKLLTTVLIAITLTACGGGGGGSSITVVLEDDITWENGIYDEWTFTSTTVSSTDINCTVDIYSRYIWWEKHINGVATGIKGSLIGTNTEERNEQCVIPVTLDSSVDNTSSVDTITNETAIDVTTYVDEDRTTTDFNGSTVIKTYRVYTDTTTTPITTTTTITTTRTNTYSDGTVTSEVINISSSNVVNNSVTTATREELTNTVVTANLINTTDSTATTSSVNSIPVVTTTSTTENRVSTDANGSTVTKTFVVYSDKTTTASTTTTVATTTTINTYSDGSTTATIANPVTTTSTLDVVTISTREELTNTVVTPNVASTSDTNSTATTSSNSNPVVTTTSVDDTRTSTDANGSTVTKVYKVYTDKTTITITTVTTITTTQTTLWTDSSATSDVISTSTSTANNDNVTSATREELISTTVTANIASTSDTDSTSTSTTEGTAITITTSATEDRTSTDANGSTVVKTFTIYTDTTTTPNATVTTIITTRTTLWTNGTSTSAVINTAETVAEEDVETVATREVLTNTVVTPNIASTSDSDSDSASTSNGTTTTVTTSATENRTSTDANSSTVVKTFTIYTDTTTAPVTTITITTTTRTTLWTDSTSTSEIVNTSTSESVTNTVTTATREELTNTVVTANVSSTSDSDSTTTSTSNGTVNVTTTSTTEDRTSTDANGSTVVKTFTIYTDTTTAPVTTIIEVTTTRTTLWTTGTSTSEIINTTSTNSTSNTVTTATREELTNTVVTANVSSTSTVYLNERNLGTIKSDLISELYGTNSDTITVGTDADGNPIQQQVTLYYYSWHKTVYDKILKDKYTRTTYTDGSVIDTLVTADVDFSTTLTKEYLLDPWGGKRTTSQRVPVGETFIGNPVAPDGSSGSSGVYTYAQRDADHSVTNYDTTTYYNDTALGTPTVDVNNDPATYETTEAENGAVLVTYANHAYARGWTGKGSTALIIDTGIDQDHPEFAGKIKYLWDAGFATPYEDEHGHGSHVAGIVSANKDGVGVHGVAFDTDLAIAKVSDNGMGGLSAAKQALEWAKAFDDIVVANLSINTSYDDTYKNAMTDQGNGVFTNSHSDYGGTNYYNLEDASTWADVLPSELVLVVSAGNTEAGYVQNPATLASAVDANGVLELDGRMLIAGNWNTSTQTIDGAKSGHVCKDYTTQCNDTYKTSDFYLLAPGTNINSIDNGGGYTRMSGTSMAAPVITAGVSIVHQMWPYMEGSNIAQVLLQTADKNLSNYSVDTHGQGLLDLDQATQPVGTLGISTTGRTGNTANVSGTISVSGLDSASVSSVSAVDDFDRDFTVDLSSMVTDSNTSLEHLNHKPGQSWGIKYANISTQEYKNFTVGTNSKGSYALGYKHNLNNNLDLSVTYSKSNTSPWIDMSGVWGEVNGATTIDTNLTWKRNNVWAQAGVMNTKTDIKKGLVVNIDDAISAYAIGGLTLDDFTLYAGIKPTVIKGRLDLSVPNSVDLDGVMHYNSTSNNYGTDTIPFIGVKSVLYFNENSTDLSLRTDVIADENGKHLFNMVVEYKF